MSIPYLRSPKALRLSVANFVLIFQNSKVGYLRYRIIECQLVSFVLF